MKKPGSLLFVFVTIFYFSSCNNSDESQSLLFQNNFEDIIFWNDASNNVYTVMKTNEAHSGLFVSKTDTVYRYSYLFKAKLGQITQKSILKLTASVWVKVKTLDTRAVVVLSVDSAGTFLNWEGKEITPSIVKTNEWTEIKHELIFEKPINNPDFNIGFYVWNKGDYEVLVDDMRLDVME